MLLSTQGALRQAILSIKASQCHGLASMLLPHLGRWELERQCKLVHVSATSQAPEDDKNDSTEGTFSLCSQLRMLTSLACPSLQP